MRRPLSIAAAALTCLVLAAPAAAQETTPSVGGAAAPAPGETVAPAETVPPVEAVPPAQTDEAMPDAAVPPATTPTTATAPAETATTTTETTPSTTPAATTPADDGDGPPAWLVGLGVLAALAVLCLLAWGLARLFAWEPGWLPTARHALGEAGYRTGATWAEFRDWLRLRREDR